MVATWVVMAASYEARAFGIHSAMHATEARRLCPEVVAVEPRGEAYAEASEALFEVFDAASPVVERHGMEEAFLEGPPALGARLRETGPARGRAAGHGRRRGHEDRGEDGQPRGQAGRAADRRATSARSCTPTASSSCGASGKATAARLHARGIATVGEAAALSQPELVALLGTRERPPRARAGQQPRPRAGPARAAAARVRLHALARPRRPPAGGARAGRRARRGATARHRASPAARSRCTCASTTTRRPTRSRTLPAAIDDATIDRRDRRRAGGHAAPAHAHRRQRRQPGGGG